MPSKRRLERGSTERECSSGRTGERLDVLDLVRRQNSRELPDGLIRRRKLAGLFTIQVGVPEAEPEPETETEWLKRRRDAMESELNRTFNLPRESWRAFCVHGWHERAPDSVDDLDIIVAPSSTAYGEHPELWRELVRHTRNLSDQDRSTAVWTAGVAWVADAALRYPERRFLFGRMLEAFDVNRRHPEIGRKLMHNIRAAGGRETARKRHAEHVEENVTPYREEYRQLLKAARQDSPTRSYQELSGPIIAKMAKRDGKRVKWMRDTIQPRHIWRELRDVG